MESLFSSDEIEKVAAIAKMIAREIVRELNAQNAAPVFRVSDALVSASIAAVGPITVDANRHEVRVDGNVIDLKPREFTLMQVLAKNAGRALSRAQLLDLAWPHDALDLDDRTVDVHVSRLRCKLGAAGRRLVTIKGLGYRLDAR